MGGFPMTSYDLTDIDMKNNNLPQREMKGNNKFMGNNIRAPGSRGTGLRFSQDAVPQSTTAHTSKNNGRQTGSGVR